MFTILSNFFTQLPFKYSPKCHHFRSISGDLGKDHTGQGHLLSKSSPSTGLDSASSFHRIRQRVVRRASESSALQSDWTCNSLSPIMAGGELSPWPLEATGSSGDGQETSDRISPACIDIGSGLGRRTPVRRARRASSTTDYTSPF